jgi:hypothetical protein
MIQRKPLLIVLGLGILGLWGVSVLVMGQVDSLATALQQYEAQTKKKVDREKADDLVGWAKWCYQHDLAREAGLIAVEGLQKAPDDLRLKYLAYALAGAGGGTITPPEDTETITKKVTITKEEADKIFQDEGADVMGRFRGVQNQVLIPRCGKCHGGGNEKAKVKWGLIAKSTDERAMLAENFRAVSPYINRDDRMKSDILAYPRSKPENVHTQVFKADKDNGYDLMLRWILAVKRPDIFGPSPAPKK